MRIAKTDKLFLVTAVIPVVIALLMIMPAGYASLQNPLAAAGAGGSAPSSKFQTIPNTAASGYSQISNLSNGTTIPFTVYVPLTNMSLINYYSNAISTPGSPLYRHFMTSSRISSLFTNSKAYQSTLNYLSAHGFTVVTQSMNSVIVATGTVKQIKEYLGLSLGLYSNGKSAYYNAYGTPLIPGVDFYASNLTASLFSHPSTMVNQTLIDGMRKVTQQVNPLFSIEPYPATALQTVYNTTGLYSNGINGTGQTIGILDFFGDPYIAQELSYFDSIYGLQAPPALNVIPIGPYNPALGLATGWAGEISLDVESSHTMAPNAAIDLYIANGNLPLVVPISTIVSDAAVNSLSQSFSIPESTLANFPALATFYNVILPDFFYQLGAIEGITFSASTGDAGGSGYSSGPLGTPGYPSTSPFVTALGGTTTYLTFNGNAVSSFNQTAWSNYGFVPNFVNYGGSTGGISMLEPLPWYQQNLPVISHGPYTVGRMVPDVSLEASVFPGMVYVFPGNQAGISGGTSEASPLFAGLMALLGQYEGGRVGLINPALYQLASNPSVYSKTFDPITVGYNIPWTAGKGYNLVTGLGAINMGALAYYFKKMTVTAPPPTLSIKVTPQNSTGSLPFEFPQGTTITVNATVMSSVGSVTSGSFNASLNSLNGQVASTTLKLNKTTLTWEGNLTVPIMPYDTGISDVVVSGSNSSGVSGIGMAEAYLGYYASILNVFSTGSYIFNTTVAGPTSVIAMQSWITNGTTVDAPLGLFPLSYSILDKSNPVMSNGYALAGPQIILPFNSTLGVNEGTITGTYPAGPILFVGIASYLYMPVTNGVGLQQSFILGPQGVEPGSVAAGQNIYVVPFLSMPYNLFNFNAFIGSNVTFSIVNSTGVIFSQVTVPSFGSPTPFSELPVPSTTPPGLYTILISSVYNRFSGSSVTGSFYGQILVTSKANVPRVSISPSVLYEGQTAIVMANITYSNGTEVQYGMYSAFLYPSDLNPEYTLVINDLATVPIPLYYSTAAKEWVGTLYLPSGNSSGSISFENGLPDWSGYYSLLVIGLAADGLPTVSNMSHDISFYLESPLIASIQNETTTLTNKLSTLQSEVTSLTQQLTNNITSLRNNISALQANISVMKTELLGVQSQLSSLQAQLNYVNTTFGVNTSHLQVEITNLQKQDSALLNKLNAEQSGLTANRSGTTNDTYLAIGAIALAAIALVVAAVSMRRKK